jgi:hypothetical protein
MARHEYGSDAIVTQAPRDDGVVHFRVKSIAKPLSERLCEWGLASLWFLVAAVLVATAVS